MLGKLLNPFGSNGAKLAVSFRECIVFASSLSWLTQMAGDVGISRFAASKSRRLLDGWIICSCGDLHVFHFVLERLATKFLNKFQLSQNSTNFMVPLFLL